MIRAFIFVIHIQWEHFEFIQSIGLFWVDAKLDRIKMSDKLLIFTGLSFSLTLEMFIRNIKLVFLATEANRLFIV